MKKLNDFFDKWLEGKGIFYYLEDYDVPWQDLTISDELDMDYHGNHSGDKWCAPLLEKIENTPQNYNKIASIIYNKYINNWTHLWTAITKEYDPLENYNRVEKTTDNIGSHTDNFTKGSETDSYTKGSQTDNFTKGSEEDTTAYGSVETTNNTGSQSNTENSTQGQQQNSTTNVTGESNTTKEDELAAFNSTGYTDKDKSKTDNSSRTDTENETVGSRTDTSSTTIGAREDKTTTSTHTDTNTQGQRQDVNIEGQREDSSTQGQREDTTVYGNQENERNSKISGNIGVTTSQQMLESEFELRLKYNFFDVVYKDIDKVLTLKIY